VDEHQLEITLKIPNDWPLQRVTVKDSKRIGVSEGRWRGWLLGVQQIVWSQVCGMDSVICHHTKQFLLEWADRRCDQPFQEKRYVTL
jgi:hypothetical protein